MDKVHEQMTELLKGTHLSAGEKLAILKKVKSSLKDCDYKYLQAVYFPETASAARIPTPFSVPSSVFTHKFSFYMNTNSTGQGWVALAPQDTSFYCCTTGESNYDGNVNNDYLNFRGVPQSDSRYVHNSFSQVRLVGASMRVQYMGTAELESGFMVGSHVFETGPERISDEIVENGYFITRGRPHEGMRLVYLPRDQRDLEYEDLVHVISSNNTSIDVNDWLKKPEDQGGIGDDEAVQRLVITGSGSSNPSAEEVKYLNCQNIYGMGSRAGANNIRPNMLVMYWRGLPPNQQWLRVDVERHFEGVPLTTIRDIVSTARPVNSPQTIGKLMENAQTTALHSHTMQDYDKIEKVGIQQSMADAGSQSWWQNVKDWGAQHIGSGVLGAIEGGSIGGLKGALAGGAGGFLGSAFGGDGYGNNQGGGSNAPTIKQGQALALTF